MAFPKNMKSFCSPALFYFYVSIIALFLMIIQNLGNSGKYTIGTFTMLVPSVILIFVLKIIYIVFWTWILNLICKDGHKGIAWFLALLPFILLFVLIGLLMLQQF